MSQEKQYPQFALLNGISALRLMKEGDNYYYYRDGGHWSVNIIKHNNGSLTSASTMSSLNGCNLTPTTEEIWRKCNGSYTPKNFDTHGYLIGEESENNFKYLLIKR